MVLTGGGLARLLCYVTLLVHKCSIYYKEVKERGVVSGIYSILLVIFAALIASMVVSAAVAFLPLPQISTHNKHQEKLTKIVSQSIKSHFSPSLYLALIFVAPRAEQKTSFSPGFIFVRLARGPPNHTWRINF